MNRSSLVRAALAATLLSTASAAALAEPGAGGVRYSLSVTPVHTFDADLDDGGSVSTTGVIANFGLSAPVSDRLRAGADLLYTYEDWKFDNPVAFGGRAPWDNYERLGLGVPLSYRASAAWRIGFTPSIEYARERGADWGDSLIYGATFSAARTFSPSLTLGLGAGVFRRIEETRAFPYLVIDWKITDRLRLGNPFRAGPTGPAGLELAYALGNGWELAGGGAYRSYRFRLDRDGAVPNGIGEARAVPLFARLSKDLGASMRLDLYAGATVANKLTVQDERANDVAEDKTGAAPLLGLTFSARF